MPKYTNEELAIKAGAGDASARCQLWEQNERLLYKLYARYRPFCSGRVEFNDLLQTGFFAICKAANAYDPAKPFTFNSYLHYHVGNFANEALGRRGKKHVDEVSAYTPLGGDDGDELVLLDTLEDESARFVGGVEQTDIQKTVQAEILKLEPEQQTIIRLVYFCELPITCAAIHMKISPEKARAIKDKALRKLRGSRKLSALRVEFEHHYSNGPQWRLMGRPDYWELRERLERVEVEAAQFIAKARSLGKYISYGKAVAQTNYLRHKLIQAYSAAVC